MERSSLSTINVNGGTAFDRFRPCFRESHNRFAVKNFFLFLWTAILLAATYFALRIFDNLGNFSEHKKQAFEGIFGALILLVGLSVFDAFKTLAKEAPDYILAHSHYANEHTLSRGEQEERELIKRAEDWFNVAKLTRLAIRHRPDKPRKPLIALVCVLWACLFLATQTAVALTNIGAQTVDGVDFAGAYINPYSQNVIFPNLTCYFSFELDGNHSCPLDFPVPGIRDLGAVQFTAHSYGLVGLTRGQQGLACRSYSQTSEIVATNGVKDDPTYGNYIPPYFCRRNPKNQQFAYRFVEYNPAENSSTYPSFSNRIITASSGPCRHYSYVNATLERGLWNYTIKADNGTETNLFIAEQNEALAGTTYVYDGFKLPPDADDMDRVVCGPRCVWVWAHLSPPLIAPGPNSFFQCPVTVDPVSTVDPASNVIDPAHGVSDAMARYSAAAIALSGRPREPKGDDFNWKQSQYFSYGTPWSILEESGPDPADLVGAKMAEFAIRSLATLAQRNPRIPLQGAQPVLGSHLDIHWDLMAGIGASVLAVHFVLFAAIVFVSRARATGQTGAGAAQPVPQQDGGEWHGLDDHARGGMATPDYSVAESRRGLVGAEHSREWSDHSGSDDDLGEEQAQHH